jgi:oligopeptide transport system ATP-binding protein
MDSSHEPDTRPLLEVKGLTKHFPQQGGAWGRPQGVVRAVNDISFTVAHGETLGLVGESGCGKSTTGRLILRLIEATSGSVVFDGKDVLTLPEDAMRELRREMQIVFQDPYGAFNPRMNIGAILSEALERRSERLVGAQRDETIAQLLEEVHLSPNVRSRYPHEFSGGQRQRLGIARALAVEPRFIIADEPVSALDVSTQAGIVNLLLDLQQKRNLTMLFISHDLSVVRVLADRVAVMYAGRIMELAPAESLFDRPLHPYTRELLAAIPEPDPKRARRSVEVADLGEGTSHGIGGKLADRETVPLTMAAGCPYAMRCPHAMDICTVEMPPLKDYGSSVTHLAACHWVDQNNSTGK